MQRFKKAVFFLAFIFYADLNSFSFFQKQKIDQNQMVDFFWHLPCLRLRLPPSFLTSIGLRCQASSDNLVTIAIFDTSFDMQRAIQSRDLSKLYKMNYQLKCDQNLPKVEFFKKNDQSLGLDQNHLPEIEKKECFLVKPIKKNHGAYVASLILQMAPFANIISVPIFNDDGQCSKQALIQALQSVQNRSIDIVCLSLKINNFDDEDDLENREIKRLLSTFPYVVMATENTPSSVHDQYQACIVNGQEFMMPGKDLACFVWDEKLQDFALTVVSGSSMAAALMAGELADQLAKIHEV